MPGFDRFPKFARLYYVEAKIDLHKLLFLKCIINDLKPPETIKVIVSGTVPETIDLWGGQCSEGDDSLRQII